MVLGQPRAEAAGADAARRIEPREVITRASIDERVALAASVALLDRVYGKPRAFEEERIEMLVDGAA